MRYIDNKISLNSPVIYATDLSKAVVPVLFLFCVALWFILWGASCLACPFYSCFFNSFNIVITSLGEEGACLWLIVHVFVYFALAIFISFFSSSWCQGLVAASDCGTPWTFLLTFFNGNAIDLTV